MARACSASGARRSFLMSSVAAFSHLSAALITLTGAMPSRAAAASAHHEVTSAATGAQLSSRRATSAEASADRSWISRVSSASSWVR